MAITITRIFKDDVALCECSATETEERWSRPYLITCSGDDANPTVMLENAEIAFAAAFPFGAAFSAAKPRCVVVNRRIVRRPLAKKTGASEYERYCFGSVEWSTNSECRTKIWRSTSTITLVSIYDNTGTQLPTGDQAEVPYSTEHLYYRRIEEAAQWAGTTTHGEPTASTGAAMCRRASYCAGRTNQTVFLGRDSGTWICLGADPVPLGTGRYLVTYTFAYKDAEFGSEHERWGYRDSEGNYRDIVGQADFANILLLAWPDEDGGGQL